MEIVGAMATPDQLVRVEVVRRNRTDWYRIISNGEVVADYLAIGTVAFMLKKHCGVELAALTEVSHPR